MKIKFTLVCFFLIGIANNSFAQLHWLLAANPNTGADAVTSQSLSTFGTDNTVGNYDLRFEVIGNPAMAINYSNQFVGIGNYNNFSPNYLLHLDGGTGNNVYQQFTNGATTGTASTDGFKIGITSGKIAEINQQEDIGMKILTGGNLRIAVAASSYYGRVAIGGNNTTPARMVDVTGDVNSPSTQLRLNYYNSSTLFTDIGTLSSGDLRIDPKNGSTNKFLGITVDPQRKLDVLDPNQYQLRLTYDGTHYSDIGTSSAGNLILMPLASGVVKQVGVGTTSTTAALTVEANTNTDGIDVTNSTSSGYGVKVTESGSASIGADITADAYGIKANANGSTNSSNYGVYTKASLATTNNYALRADASVAGVNNIAVYATAGNGSTSNIAVDGETIATDYYTPNIGVLGTGQSGGCTTCTLGASSSISNLANVGVVGVGSTYTTGANIGVYGLGIGSTLGATGNWGGYFDGSLNVNGSAYSTSGNWTGSDVTIKQDITPVDEATATELVMQLQPSTYYFDTAANPLLRLSSKKQWGFISQDVNSILPELTSTVNYSKVDDQGNTVLQPVMMLNYQEIIPILTATVQNQQTQNEALQTQVTDQQNQLTDLQNQLSNLQDQLNGCCGLHSPEHRDDGGSSSQTIELKSSQAPLLGNAIPNPNSTQCNVAYYVPADAGAAQIIFTDELGRTVNTVDLLTKGQGQLTLLTSQLEDGVYNYSLVIDGKVIDSKKMVKQH